MKRPGNAAVAAAAMGLALGGILLALAGRETGSTLLQDRIGPLVTLSGALVWLLGRRRPR